MRGQDSEAALTCARAQSKPKPRVSMSPDIAIEEAKLKATKLEKALGNSSGAEDCLQRALAKAREAAWERPLEVQIKECREFINRAEHGVWRQTLWPRRPCWRKAGHN